LQKEQSPKIDVLIAVYNGEKFLKQQLESILAQTYKNIEIYISDDKSTDNTLKILSLYQKKYPKKLFYSSNEKNVGLVKNFENLISNCSSEYIALSDQDDIWAKNKLEIQINEMLKMEEIDDNRACLVHSDLSMIDDHSHLINRSYFKYRNYHLKLKKDLGHILGPCGVMGNTILLNKKLKDIILPFPEELDFHDYWIAVNCELFGKRKTLKLQLVKYRIHYNNSSNSKEKFDKRKKHKFNRDIKLPNLETNRKYFLSTLRNKIKIDTDIKIFDAYLDYLEFKKSKTSIYLNLLKHSLVNRKIYFRTKMAFKIFLTKRY